MYHPPFLGFSGTPWCLEQLFLLPYLLTRTGRRPLKRGRGPTGLGLSCPGGEKDLQKILVSAGEIQRGITSPKHCQSFSKQEVKRKLFIAYLFVFRPLLFFLFWDKLFCCLLLLFKTSGAFVFLFFFLPFFFFSSQNADASSASKHRTSSREKICNLIS